MTGSAFAWVMLRSRPPTLHGEYVVRRVRVAVSIGCKTRHMPRPANCACIDKCGKGNDRLAAAILCKMWGVPMSYGPSCFT